MKRIDCDSIADIGFEMKWTSPEAEHTERCEAVGVNFWRDMFPGTLCRDLMGKIAGDRVQISLAPGKGLPTYDPSGHFALTKNCCVCCMGNTERKLFFLTDWISAYRFDNFSKVVKSCSGYFGVPAYISVSASSCSRENIQKRGLNADNFH